MSNSFDLLKVYNTKHTSTIHIMARQQASSEKNSNNNIIQL